MLRMPNPHCTHVSSCPQGRLLQYLRSRVPHAVRSTPVPKKSIHIWHTRCRETHQRCTSVPACLSTQVFDTADCEPKSRKAAAQSIRTGTACQLTMSRTLACMLTTADDISAHWNTRLFHWNTRANPSVPDQIVTQRPETHNAHIFSVI